MNTKTIASYCVCSILSALTLGKALAANDDAKTYFFECISGTEFVLDTSKKGNWLFHEQQTLQLEAPRGLVAYTAPGLELQIHEGRAILREEGKTTLICQNNQQRAIWEHAKLNGVDFRAVGNEPGWVLEFVEGNKIIYTGDYNAIRIEKPLPEAVPDATGQTTRWDTGEFAVEVSGTPCKDTMSGEDFESTVTVYIDNRELHGCGRALH